MTWPDDATPAIHTLSPHDLRAFVTSTGQGAALRRLRAAQYSKHKILLAAVMRMAARARPAAHTRTLADAYRLLAQVEARDHAVVRDLIASPQFGAWAADCVGRLRAADSPRRGGAPLSTDLGQLAAVAAAAAYRAGHSFEIEVPLRHGAVTFPAFGTARPGAFGPWEWARVGQDGRGMRVRSSVSTVAIPAAGEQPAASGAWRALPRLLADADGLRLDVTLDSQDPFLDRYGAARERVTARDAVRWRRLLVEAWRVLTGCDYPLAEMVAAMARTVVPLTAPAPTRPVSSTETASFGALGMSLPRDALAMAEVLVHETHHAVLGAVMDIVPMFGTDDVPLTYAPWREDPRPATALLQGVYTHYGITRFWREQRRTGSSAQRFRGHVEFGRWRLLTTQTAERLARLAALTEPGGRFLSVIRAKLAEWQDEPVPAAAADHIADLNLDHRARWRLRHLVPDQTAVESLAAAWRRGARPPVPAARVAVTLEPGPLPGTSDNARAYLLMLRYQDPPGFRELGLRELRLRDLAGRACADPADAALAAGDYALAADAYGARIDGADIDSGDSGDAWAGLAVARGHTGPGHAAWLLAERPEVAAALHRRVRGDAGASADALVAWLADGP